MNIQHWTPETSELTDPARHSSEQWRETQARQDAPGMHRTPARAPLPHQPYYRAHCPIWSPLCTAILAGFLVGIGVGVFLSEALR